MSIYQCLAIEIDFEISQVSTVDLQTLVNAERSTTRSQKADTALLNQQATCASALPTD